MAALESAAGASRLLSFDFADPVGKLELTQCFAGTQKDATQREATGTIAGNGGALFEDAPVLAHFLARHSTPAKLSKALLGESNEAHAADTSALAKVLRALEKTAAASNGNAWSNMRCLELGAGLGLCSMVCTKLGMRVVATDGDASVLEALKANAQRDIDAEASAASTTTAGLSKLERGELRPHLLQWGNAESIEQVKELGGGETSTKEADGSGSFDLIIATGCVYGRESGVWQQLVDTLVALSTPNHTLVLLAHGTGAAPGTHALRGDFYALADPWFYVGRAPFASCNHPDHPGVQVKHATRLKRWHKYFKKRIFDIQRITCLRIFTFTILAGHSHAAKLPAQNSFMNQFTLKPPNAFFCTGALSGAALRGRFSASKSLEEAE